MRSICVAAASCFALSAVAEQGAWRTTAQFAPLAPGLVQAPPTSGAPPHEQSLLVLVDGLRPIAVATPEAGGPPGVFRLSESAQARLRARPRPDAWIVPSAAAAPPDHWPAELPRYATIDTVSPAQQTVWIDAGARHGVATGDTWWLRVPRQPAARLDVLCATDDLAFARVTPLAQDVTVEVGQAASTWPAAPNEARSSARSAVAHVSGEGGEPLVWIAALPGIEAPSEPHVDFFRAGRWVGHGLVQRTDDRFWYAGLISQAAGAPRVGDDVLIRTQAEIVGRRVVARVFERTEQGAVIDAGERDGFAVGQTATAYRDGTFLTRVVTLDVQDTYAIVAPEVRPGETPPVLAAGDAIHLAPPPPPNTPLGEIVAVTDEQLVAVRLGADAPLNTPLIVERDGEPVALVILLAADHATAAGYVVPRSSAVPVAPGLPVLRPARAPASPGVQTHEGSAAPERGR